jgi:FMN reductase
MGPRIVGLGGSLASASKSRAALQRALEGASAAGAEIRLLDLRELDLPMYNPDDDEPNEAAAELIETCYAADGLLWSSPLYQGTISGALKNALDWLHVLGQREPPYLHDKVIGLISAAGGTQGLQAINTMEFAVRALRGWAVPLRRACRGGGPRVRSGRWDPRRVDRAPADDPRWRGSARRRTVRSRWFPSPRGRVCMCSRKGRERWVTT